MDSKLNSLRITSLDDDEEEEAAEAIEMDDDDDDDEDEEAIVTLGFVQKPKDPQSLLRHYFPSKAGGVPVPT